MIKTTAITAQQTSMMQNTVHSPELDAHIVHLKKKYQHYIARERTWKQERNDANLCVWSAPCRIDQEFISSVDSTFCGDGFILKVTGSFRKPRSICVENSRSDAFAMQTKDCIKCETLVNIPTKVPTASVFASSASAASPGFSCASACAKHSQQHKGLVTCIKDVRFKGLPWPIMWGDHQMLSLFHDVPCNGSNGAFITLANTLSNDQLRQLFSASTPIQYDSACSIAHDVISYMKLFQDETSPKVTRFEFIGTYCTPNVPLYFSQGFITRVVTDSFACAIALHE